VSTLEYDYGTVLLTRLTRSYPPVTSVVRHNGARLTRAKLRRWTRRQEFHFYGGQNRKMYFQGSESTFISTQLLTRTLYEAATSHTSFTSAAGEGLARYRPCVVCLGRAVCDLSALRSPDRIRNMDSCLRQHVRNLLIINVTYQLRTDGGPGKQKSTMPPRRTWRWSAAVVQRSSSRPIIRCYPDGFERPSSNGCCGLGLSVWADWTSWCCLGWTLRTLTPSWKQNG
jgi:hypothetical protein